MQPGGAMAAPRLRSRVHSPARTTANSTQFADIFSIILFYYLCAKSTTYCREHLHRHATRRRQHLRQRHQVLEYVEVFRLAPLRACNLLPPTSDDVCDTLSSLLYTGCLRLKKSVCDALPTTFPHISFAKEVFMISLSLAHRVPLPAPKMASIDRAHGPTLV